METPNLDIIATVPPPDGRDPNWSIGDRIFAGAIAEIMAMVAAGDARVSTIARSIHELGNNVLATQGQLREEVRGSLEQLQARIDTAQGTEPGEDVVPVWELLQLLGEQVKQRWPNATVIDIRGLIAEDDS